MGVSIHTFIPYTIDGTLETIKVSKERAFMEVFMLFYQQQ